MAVSVKINNVTYSDVPSVKLPLASGSGYAEFTLGGGGGVAQYVYMGTATPSASLGADGDIYIHADNGGSVEAYPGDYTAQNMNSTTNLSACLGKSADEGSSTSNVYSSGQSTTGIADYSFDLSSIPSNANITSVTCSVKAHEENASRSTCRLQLYSGSTAKGSSTTVNGTSNAIYSLTTGSWTRAELDSLTLRMSVGYYGGLIAGATLAISYTMDSASYEVTLTGDASAWSIKGTGIYKKTNGSWTSTSAVQLEDSIGRG